MNGGEGQERGVREGGGGESEWRRMMRRRKRIRTKKRRRRRRSRRWTSSEALHLRHQEFEDPEYFLLSDREITVGFSAALK